MRLSLPFRVERPAVDESHIPGESPKVRAVRLAHAKAETVAIRYPDAVVIGSDQVCALGAGVLDKAGTRSGQEAQLAALSGNSADFHTAICLRCVALNFTFAHTDLTRCVFRQLSRDTIADYANREPALDCAGGFKVEGLGITLLERVEALDPTALVGLPLIALHCGLAALSARVRAG